VHALEVTEELLDDVLFGPHADAMNNANQELYQLINSRSREVRGGIRYQ